ncbi:MAG: PAS domain S-box protein [Bacteroidetes bacterium]|jgi:PAS domain S-box-containing protein|nr:PAS domain S-box protein [Bacteroidota bacterium]
MDRLQEHLRVSTPESIALLYLVLAYLWILFSDQLLLSLFATPETLTEMQTVKGLFYVTATGVLLYLLIRNSVRKLQAKEAEERAVRKQLEERAATLNAVIDSIPDAVFIGTEGGLDQMNDAARALIGDAAEDAVEHIGTTLNVRHPETSDPIPAAEYPFVRALHGTASTRELLVDAPPDAADRYVRASAAPIRKNGDVIGAVSIISDITERKQLEYALRASEEQYRTLFFNNPAPMWIYDRTTCRILEVNQAALEQYGYPREDFLELTLFDLRPPDEHDRLAHHLDQDRPDLQYSGPWVHQRKDNSLLEVEVISHTLAFEDREAVLVLARDVTERNRMARQNKRYNQELKTLLAVSRRLARELDLPALLDLVAKATVETVTEAEAASLWLYDAAQRHFEATAYHGHDEHLSGLTVTAQTSLLGAVFDRAAPYVVEDVRSDPHFEDLLPEHPDSSLHRIRSVALVPLQIEDEIIGILGADSFSRTHAFGEKDVRLLESLAALASIAIQNSRLFRELRVMSMRLLDVQETERRRIAQELHDEVGGLLTSLVLSLQMTPTPTPELERALAESQELVTSLMNQVRQLSLDLRPSTLDDLGLQPALEEYIRRYEGRTQITLHFDVDLDAGKRLNAAVETTAYRIVQEALTNVARHAEAAEATVRLRVTDETLEVVVRDEGRGFDPDDLDGDSMGLSGMRERAALIGGHLTIHSAPDAGTTLTAHLPLGSVVSSPDVPSA